MRDKGMTRRGFLAWAGAAGGMIVIGDQLMRLGTHAPSLSNSGDRIRVAVAGLGRQGRLLLKSFMEMPGVEIASLCDVDEGARNRARALVETTRGLRPRLFSDVRRVLDDRHIDAVAVAAPNHWHSLMGIWACQAGKDCYIESPCSHTFFEGRRLVAAAQKYRRIVQYGSLGQANGLSGFDAVTAACIGPIRSIRTICFSNKAPARYAPPLFMNSRDFDLWLGPARFEQSRRTKLNWQKYPPMHNGALGFFALDDLHRDLRLLGSELPTRVSTLSSERAASVARGPRIAVRMEFGGSGPGQARRLDLEVLPMAAMPREIERRAAELQGAEASRKLPLSGVVSEMTVRGTTGSFTATSLRNPAGETAYLVRNFIEAVRERKQELLASPIEQAHVTCGSLHLANISLVLNRPLNFDPAIQSSGHDEQVNELLLGSHRAPYTLPKRV